MVASNGCISICCQICRQVSALTGRYSTLLFDLFLNGRFRRRSLFLLLWKCFDKSLYIVIRCSIEITHVVSNSILFKRWIKADMNFFLVRLVKFVVWISIFRFGLLKGLLVFAPVHEEFFELLRFPLSTSSKILVSFIEWFLKPLKSFLSSGRH